MSASNPQLEQVILDNPGDSNAWRVFGDWLQEQNDPRGELIALDLALAQDPDNADAKQKRDALIEANRVSWLGAELSAIDNKNVLDIQWQYGFIQKARVAWEYDFDGPDTHELLQKVLQNTASRFISELVIGVTEGAEDGDASFTDVIDVLAAAERPALQRLTIGDFDSEDCEISWSSIGDVSPVYTKAPNLEYLRIHGGGIELGDIKLDKLKTLIIESGGLPAAAIEPIAGANLPTLEKLHVWFGTEEYDGELEMSMLDSFWDGGGYPNLKNLGLMNSDLQNDLAKRVVTAPILKQLQTLDLSMGTMTDEGAQVLLDHAAALAHLAAINVDENFISDEVCKKLEQAFGDKINIGSQEDAEDDYLFVSVGE